FAAERFGGGGKRSSKAAVVAVAASMALIAVFRLRPSARLAGTLALLPPLVRVVPVALVGAALVRLGSRLVRRAPTGALAAVPDAVVWVATLFGLRLFLAAGYVGPYDAFFLPLPILVALAGLY